MIRVVCIVVAVYCLSIIYILTSNTKSQLLRGGKENEVVDNQFSYEDDEEYTLNIQRHNLESLILEGLPPPRVKHKLKQI